MCVCIYICVCVCIYIYIIVANYFFKFQNNTNHESDKLNKASLLFLIFLTCPDILSI